MLKQRAIVHHAVVADVGVVVPVGDSPDLRAQPDEHAVPALQADGVASK